MYVISFDIVKLVLICVMLFVGKKT